jgi:hypothetical protein
MCSLIVFSQHVVKLICHLASLVARISLIHFETGHRTALSDKGLAHIGLRSLFPSMMPLVSLKSRLRQTSSCIAVTSGVTKPLPSVIERFVRQQFVDTPFTLPVRVLNR